MISEPWGTRLKVFYNAHRATIHMGGWGMSTYMAENLGTTSSHVRFYVEKLVTMGYAKKLSRGRYEPTLKAKRTLAKSLQKDVDGFY